MADKEENITIKEYTRSLGGWMEQMQLSADLKATVRDAQVVLLPAGYIDCPEAFAHDALDFLHYCQQAGTLKAEICCTDENFTQLELCSFKVNIGRILALSTVSGTIFWNLVSSYIYDKCKVYMEQTTTIEIPEQPEYMNGPECSFSVIITDATGKNIEVSYDGPASKIDKVGETIIKLTQPEVPSKDSLN
ncbi:MAG: hypothetical protein NC206_10105 [Bacteroides sp.]|nr:hypothetical protein [Roseburia sp.]MCM1347419.1 hypothetical protein [Bacteroides sp.]MCM1421577.1 hypothetical protein [Bacteroides sp.]